MPIFPRSSSSGGGSLKQTVLTPSRQSEPEGAPRVGLLPPPLPRRDVSGDGSTITQTSSLTSTGTRGASGTSSISVSSTVTGTGAEGDQGSGAITASHSITSSGTKSTAGNASAISVASSSTSAGTRSTSGAGIIGATTVVSGAGEEGSGGTGALTSASTTAGAGVKAARGAGELAVDVATEGAGLMAATGASAIVVAWRVEGTGAGLATWRGIVVPHYSVPVRTKQRLEGAGRIEVASSVSGAGAVGRFGKAGIGTHSLVLRASGGRAGKGFVFVGPVVVGARGVHGPSRRDRDEEALLLLG